MELNAKSPFLWDWENLVMINPKGPEAPKKLQLIDSEIEGIEGFEIGSFYSSGGSDLGCASSSKSSKSASVDSSTYKDLRGTHFSLINNDNNSCGITRTSPTIESSSVSGESFIALELGKRTYFEDVSGSNNAKDSSRGVVSSKKSKSSNLGSDTPCCQVQDCNLDLSYAKDYHKKHRVCEIHSKSSKVVINGIERRFCQQCSRFHGLSEFDQKKRSCRRRLSDHNARRRKPKPEVVQFDTMRLTSSVFEGRNQLNLAFGQVPMLQNKRGTLDNTNPSKITLHQPDFSNSIKSGGTHDGLQNPSTKVSHVSTHSLPSKGPTSHVYQRDLPVSIAPSNMGAAQDMRALSLLSTSLWGPSDSEPSVLHPSIHTNNTSSTEPLTLGGDPPIVPDFWNSEHQLVNSDHGSHNSAFQLFKAPNESSFFLY